MYKIKDGQPAIRPLIYLALIFVFLVNTAVLLFAGEADIEQTLKGLNLKEGKVFSLQGDVQVKRPGGDWQEVEKSTLLRPEDRLGLGKNSAIEIYFEERKDLLIELLGRSEFTFKDITSSVPAGYELSLDAKTQVTKVTLFLKEDAYYKRYIQGLAKQKIPYTLVSVFDGVVDVASLASDKGCSSEAIGGGYSTYVFQNRCAFPALTTKEALEVCVEDCTWGSSMQ